MAASFITLQNKEGILKNNQICNVSLELLIQMYASGRKNKNIIKFFIKIPKSGNYSRFF